MNINNVDFNLLKVFRALMETKNVTKAAGKLFLTQSATSHALKRLRDVFDDQLFISTPRGMKPTDKSLEIYPRLAAAIDDIEACVNRNSRFDPNESEHEFVILTNEYFEMVLLPQLTERLYKLAPKCRIEVRRMSSDIPIEDFEMGRIDLLIGFRDYIKVPSIFKEWPLISDHLVCMMSKEHAPEGGLDMETFLEMPHIYPIPWGKKTNMVDTWLNEQGLSRTVSVTVPNYVAGALAVASSGHILTMPSQVANIIEGLGTVAVLDPPTDYPDFEITVVAHRLFENESANRWLRETIQDVAKSVMNKEKLPAPSEDSAYESHSLPH